LAELAASAGYSVNHLGWLVRQGRLDAIKRGGRWYSTPEALRQYEQDVQTGRFPAGRPKKSK
jgi:hypothetical protein